MRRSPTSHSNAQVWSALHPSGIFEDGAFTSDGRLSHAGATRILQSAVRVLVGSDRMGRGPPESELALRRRGARSPTEIPGLTVPTRARTGHVPTR